MKREILGAVVLTLGLGLGAGLAGEARAFPGGTVAIGADQAATGTLLRQVDHKKHHKHWHKKKHHHHHRKHHHHGGGIVFSLGGLFAAPQQCHAVAHDGYVQGRYAKIGATQCYDPYGRAYIVPDSQHVIHFY